jgi:hypothetical protein
LRGPSPYLFPGLGARDQPISKTAINRAIERMALPFPIVPHGFRSTFATITREHDLGSHDAIELALAHHLGGEVERAYNRATLLKRRRELMQKWSDLLVRLAQRKWGALWRHWPLSTHTRRWRFSGPVADALCKLPPVDFFEQCRA